MGHGFAAFEKRNVSSLHWLVGYMKIIPYIIGSIQQVDVE